MNESTGAQQTTGLEVAIIGMAGRFPGAPTIAAFWQNLRDGVESVTFFTEQELLASGIGRAELSDPNYVRARAIIESVDLFDAAFFAFTPREAEITEPQKRLFLEVAWEALEHAGYTTSAAGAPPIGIYAGLGTNTYLLNNLYADTDRLVKWGGTAQSVIGNDKDFLTTLTAYKLNLTGPAVTVQTACSTSLVAVHLACQSLLNGECDMALAGGVSFTVPQRIGYPYEESGFASPDGHCRAFDALGQGFVSGSGAGVVVLKRLADALDDGDSICAVIKGSAINNDGTTKVGYSAPSIEGQTKVIRAAQVMAEVEVETISYVEAHGTGTALGDPVEVAALTRAFRIGTDKRGFCGLGSVKTNIGHLDTAAGVAGLIKTVLALQHRQIPPSLHFRSPNPQIDFASSPFYVNATLAEWPADGAPRRSGVSSFGMGGTNAHAVLEEAPPPQPAAPSRPWQLLLLSARTATALERATDRLRDHLQEHHEQALADVAYTLQAGRKVFEHRRMLVCRDREDALAALESRDSQRLIVRFQEPADRPIAFMFPGGGAQYVNMGRELYETEAVFRAEVDRCADLLQPHLGLDIRALLYPDGDKETGRQGDTEAPDLLVSLSPGLDPGAPVPPSHPKPLRSETLTRTSTALPALFVVEYALARLWMAWGVRPQAMIGHSLGEYVAACLADVLTLDDALALVALRGRLFEQLPEGAMLSVSLPEEQVLPLLGEELSLAAVNGPALCVVSGAVGAIKRVHAALAERGVDSGRLHIAAAGHSALVAPILEPFGRFVATLPLQEPRIPYLSNVTGDWITAAEATDPNYWVRHLRQTVRFAAGVQTLLCEPDRILLEVGPGQTLSALARQQPDDSAGRVVLSSLRHARDRQPDVPFLLNTLGQLWLAGVRVNWSEFYAEERRQRIPLPTYPFERQRYWVEAPTSAPGAGARRARNGRRPDLDDWFYIPSWKRSAPPDLALASIPADATDGWLVFLDTAGLGDELMAHLERRSQLVVGVTAGDSFARLDERRYRLRPRCREDYGALFDALRADGPLPRTIIHLWALDTPADDVAAAEQEFYSLLYLAQALGEARDEAPRRLVIGSNQLHAVTGDEDLVPAHATLLGPCLVLPREYPQLTCRAIDFALPQGRPAPLAQLRDQLITEVAADAPDHVVAYRGAHRWVQTVEPQRLAPAPEPHPRLREGGVYLITGGLGGIGLIFAGYLARSVRARLVLTTRAELPPRERWDERQAPADASDRFAQAIRTVRELEAQGAEVLVLRADVTDVAQMQAALSETEARFGALHGVIHAAGLGGGGLAQLKTPEAAAEVLAPKLQGTLVLERLLQQRSVDFLVLCSSLNAVLGGVGKIDYCAANAFLDAFAQRRTLRESAFTVSINWNTWAGVGMGATNQHHLLLAGLSSPNGATAGLDGVAAEAQPAHSNELLPDEGVEVLARILAMRHPLPQLLISTSDLPSYIAEVRALTQARLLAALEQLPTQASHERPELATAYAAPTTETEQLVAQLWCRVFGVERVGIHDNFFDLGGHSLMAVRLLSQLRTTFQVELSLPALFETPTIAELAEAIDTFRWAARMAAPANDAAGVDREEGEL